MDPFTLAAIAGPAIGSLFRKKEKPTEAKLDLGFLRKEAEENGFNPFSVLQATGGAGSILGGSSGGNMLAGDMVMQSLSTLSQYALDKASDDRTAARDDLRSANERATARGYIGGVQVGSSGYASRPVVNALGTSYTNGGEPSNTPTDAGIMPGPVSNGLSFAGHGLAFDRTTTDEQIIEDRYGDIAGWVYGLGVLAADAKPVIGTVLRTVAPTGYPTYGPIDMAQKAYDGWKPSTDGFPHYGPFDLVQGALRSYAPAASGVTRAPAKLRAPAARPSGALPW